MSGAVSQLAMVWSFVLAGMGIFFLIVARRLPGRGYKYLGWAVCSIAVAGLLEMLHEAAGASVSGFLAVRGALLVGILSTSLNLHFLYRYCGFEGARRILWVSYVLVGAASFANLMSSVSQLGHLAGIAFPIEYQSPSFAYSVFVLLLVGVHFLLGVGVLYRGVRGGQRVFPVFVTYVLLGPASLVDLGSSLFSNSEWYITQAGLWVYCLVILATLLFEIQRAEGLLHETTSNLEARTAELEASNAEIDVMYNELSQKQQLAAVGELAAAIAHEVRNPLAIIMNAVSGMRRVTISEKDRDTLLSIVNEESERLNHLVTELLRFARPVAASRGPASLLDICSRAAKESPEGYTVEVVQNDQLDPVLVDPGLFRLALDNLVANSAQAMPDGGTIRLSVHRGTFEDGTPAAAVDIIDRGCGMKKEDLESAKKPFFTTKPRGTGLGIPIAVRIVEAHGGEMDIESTLHQGTTVTIKLPYEEEVQRSSSYPGSKHPSTRRRLRSIPPGGVVWPEHPVRKRPRT